MGFLPARMTRLLVGGHKQHQESAIEALHAAGVLHIEDYRDPTGTTRIGTPLERGEALSDLLVRTRGLQKALGAQPTGGAGARTAGEPAETLRRAEAAAQPALEQASRLRAEAAALEAEAAALAPFAGLEFDLAGLQGLSSVKVFVGTARADPRPALARSGATHDAQAVASGSGFAAFAVVAARDAAKAEKALAESGFASAALPAGRSGTPAQRLGRVAAERGAALAALAQAEARIAALRGEWAAPLASLERHLAAEVDKTQAPLRFGVTESTFHVEGWVPRSAAERVQKALADRFGGKVYVHELGDAPVGAASDGARPGNSHGDAHANARGGSHGGSHAHGPSHGPGQHHAADHATGTGPETHGHHGEGSDGHHADPRDEPPIHLDNPKPARPYQFLLGLLGKPRYQEIDPTKLMLVFFPLFFGLMVGDLAVGILIALAGLFLKKNKVFGIGGPAVGRALVAGGLMSALVGGVVFGEALGIHFVTGAPHEEGEEKEISWEEILGMEFPHEGFLHKTGPEHAEGEAGAEGGLTTHAEGTEAKKHILAPSGDTHLSVNGWFNLGYYSKVHDTLALLVWAMIIGVVHINLALIIGFRNVAVSHGMGLAVQEKGAWILLELGAALAILLWGGFWGYVGVGLAVASIALLWMGATHTLGVGFIALLEVPALAGNVLSYTRLAAIGASKAGMAIAFGVIAFDQVGGGDYHSVAGWVVYLLAFVLIIVLSIIAGSLQSLRLQFVEFFGKFFQGGGRPYLPFGRRAP